MNNISIAYLAPELPALSATFVYEELRFLESMGFRVLPLSVHAPTVISVGQDDLAARTIVLYDRPKWLISLSSIFRLPLHAGFLHAFNWLLHDLRQVRFSNAALKLVFQFIAAERVAAICQRDEIKHLHIHFAHVPTQIGMYASAMAGIPFTVMGHANDIFENGLLLKEKAERAKRFLTISEYNRVHLTGLGIPVEKIAVVRCGVSFQPPVSWPIPSQKTCFRLGTLGRLVEKKGIDELLRALAKIPLAKLCIAGDGPMRCELEALALQLGIVSRVEFHGSLAHRDVSSWLADLDVFVLACKRDKNGDMDGIPVVLMEAMSQGIPVISTRLSGIPELVVDGETGLLAESGNVDDISNCIQKLLESADLRAKLARNASKHVNNEFGQLKNAERLVRYFDLPGALRTA